MASLNKADTDWSQDDAIESAARIAERSLRWLIPLIGIVSASNVLRWEEYGGTLSSAIQLLLTAVVCAVALLGSRLPAVFRILVYSGCAMVIGLIGLSRWGPYASGQCTILLALMLGTTLGLRRWSVMLAVALIGIVLVGAGWVSGRFALGYDPVRFIRSASAWSNAIGIFAIAAVASLIWEGMYRQLWAANRRLHESEERFRSTFEQVAVGIVHVATDGRLLRSNGRFREILGYSTGELERLTLRDITYPADLNADEQLAARLLAGEIDTYSAQKRYLRRDGSPVWVNLTGSIVRDAAGQADHMVGVVEDIDARRRAEEERDRLFNSSLDLLCVAGFDGYFRQLNPAWERTLGWSDEELLGRPWIEFVHPDDRESTIAADRRLQESRPVHQFENRYRCKDGSWRWLSWNSFPLIGQQQILAVVRDVTENKMSEEALRRSEERYRRITQAITDYIFTVRLENQMPVETIHGAACEAVTGYTSEEFHRDPLLWIRMVHPEDHEAVCCQAACVIEGGMPEPLEHRIRRKDGALRWVQSTLVPHCDPSGLVVAYDGLIRDITERRQAQEAAHRSQATLGSVFRAAPVGIGLVKNRVLQHVNERVCRMTGYTETELIGSSSRMLYPTDEDFEFVGREKYRQIAVHGTGTVETRWRRRDGSICDVLLSSTPLDVTDPGAGVTFTALDITERKQAEEALRLHNQRLRIIAEASSSVLTSASLRGQYEHETRRIREVFEADLCVIRVLEGEGLVLFSKDGEHAEMLYERIKASAGIGREIISARRAMAIADVREDPRTAPLAVPAPGHYAFISYAGAPLLCEGEVVGIVGIYTSKRRRDFSPTDLEHLQIVANSIAAAILNQRLYGEVTRQKEQLEKDVAERKQAEEALRESERRYRGLFETIQEGFSLHEMIYDSEGRPADYRYIDVNPAFEQMTGIPRSRWIGNTVREVLPDVEEHWIQTYGEVARTGTPWHGENYVQELDRYYEVVAYSPNRGQFASIALDITSRKRAEQARQRLEAQLRQAQKMEAIGHLAGGVAHDFNNLLQAILGYAELAAVAAEDDEELREPLAEIRKAGERAASLTSQLLAFSRRQVLELAPLDLNVVVEDLVKMVRRLIGENIDLAVNPDPALAHVNADRGQIEQVLVNLCVNARDAMPAGGRLTIETQNVAIDEQYCAAEDWARPGRYVLLSVTDSGCGMDDDTVKQVFEPFFTTKEVGKGTGLGLATAYGIVRQHEGMVQVYSEVGKGSRFKVYLPAIEQSPVAEAGKPAEVAAGGHEIILLAEDDDQIRALARTLLEGAGYRVLPASDGEAALRVYREQRGRIDLLVLDVVMPKRGGRDVFDEIQVSDPDVRCLFMSGYSEDAIHTDFILEAGLRLLQKPFRKEQLLRTVRQILDASKA